MASELAITAATNQIELDAGRKGETSFTVSNASTRTLRARVMITPTAPAAADWFKVAGDVERSFPVDGTQQFTVQVTVPPTVSTGNYSFRLDALNLENPDEDYVQGPSVAFGVVDKPIVIQVRKGYMATLIGLVVGLLAGVAVGFLLGSIVSGLFGNSELGGTIQTVLTWVLGLAGGVVGAGFALRMGSYEYFIETIMVLAGALPVWMAIVVGFLLLIGSPNILQKGGTPALILLCVAGPVALIVPPLAARAIALLMKTGKI